MIFKDHKAREWIAELQAEMLKHARELAALKLEWQDTYDRILKLTQRMAKRAEIAEKLAADVSSQEPAASSASDDGEPAPSSLTERQRQLNERILARRARKTEVTQ